ncbi:MAG: AAA family ATPase [Nocardioides sp.]
MTGAQASGKTTVGEGLARRLGRAVHVDGDVIDRFVIAGEVPYGVPPPPGAEEQLLLRYEGAMLVAALYARSGFDAVVSDNIFGRHLDAVLRRAHELAPGRVHLVVLDPDEAVLARRDREREKTGYDESLTPALLVAAVREETARAGLWVDNGAHSVEETVSFVLENLEAARLQRLDSLGQEPPETIGG